MNLSPSHFLVPAAAVLLSVSSGLAGEHGEIGVGRTADLQLMAVTTFPQPVLLPRSIYPGFTGSVTSLLGFADLTVDDPDGGVFSLAPTSDIAARLVAADPGAAVFDGLTALAIGASMSFGPPVFDYHPLFSIPSPAAVPGDVFALRFVLFDRSGLYTDSPEFSIQMTPACPADFDLSGSVGVQDLFDYLAAYFGGSGLIADFNGSGAVSVQDLFDFLAAFFAPCV